VVWIDILIIKSQTFWQGLPNDIFIVMFAVLVSWHPTVHLIQLCSFKTVEPRFTSLKARL